MCGVVSAVEYVGLGHRVVLEKCPQTPQIMSRKPALTLDLESHNAAGSIEDEIDLHATSRSPIIQIVVHPQVLTRRTQLLEHKGLQRGTVYLFGRIQRTAWANGSVDARVEEIVLRVTGQASFSTLLKHGHADADEVNRSTAMNVDQFLPLRPVEFQVLVSLSQGDRHGYAILQEIEERGEGGTVPGLATLHRAIVRLEKETLICRTENGAAAVDDERRRVYGITGLGKAVVEAEARRLAPMVDLVNGATT